MSVTPAAMLSAAEDSLKRILDTDTSQWSEGQLSQRQLEIDKLERVIDRYERKVAAAAGRRIFSPVKRVDL